MLKKLLMAALVAAAVVLAGCGAGATQQAASAADNQVQTASSKTYAKDALNKAAYNGDEKEVAAILKTTPDPDGRDSSGGTALHAAMFQKNIKREPMCTKEEEY